MDDQLTADELRAWRKEAGLTQPEFAGMLGISTATVARWERRDDAAPWKLLALARDGWRARQMIPALERPLTEDDIRRIAQEEIRKASPGR